MNLENFKEKIESFQEKILPQQKEKLLSGFLIGYSQKTIIKFIINVSITFFTYYGCTSGLFENHFMNPLIIGLYGLFGISHMIKFLLKNIILNKAKKSVIESKTLIESIEKFKKYSNENQIFNDFFVNEKIKDDILNKVKELDEENIKKFQDELDEEEVKVFLTVLKESYNTEYNFFTVNVFDKLLNYIYHYKVKEKQEIEKKNINNTIDNKMINIFGSALLEVKKEIHEDIFEKKEKKKDLKNIL